MALPKEPRQKMINMMYLVLTAMLAMNVSAEILNAFKTVNSSLENSNTTVHKSTETIMTSLKAKMSEPTTAEKAGIWYPKAEQVQNHTNELFNYIKSLKDQILKESGYDPAKGKLDYKEDNLDVATRILVEKGAGKELLKRLTDYEAKVITVDSAVAKEFRNNLPIDLTMPKTQNKGNKTWEAAYFRMVPTVAALTILSKFQNDLKTSENKIIAYCHNKVGEVAVRFDTYSAIVGQSSSYLMPGEELEITAGVGAFSKTAQPIVTIGGANVSIGPDGAAHWKTTVNAMGANSLNVNVTYTDQDGMKQTISKQIDYTVGQANASIALDKMNVLYIGVDNPITIAASGGAEQIQTNITGGGGSISGSRGKYIARVNTITDDCRVSVSVNGKIVGASKFRVRTIPTPVATVGGFSSGDNVPAGAFRAQSGVGAYIKDFPFELSYSVTSFTLTSDTDDGDIEEAPCAGNTWSPKAQTMLRNMKAGRLVTIDNIRAVGPDGTSRKLPSLVYYIK